jgi:hypothetical protein
MFGAVTLRRRSGRQLAVAALVLSFAVPPTVAHRQAPAQAAGAACTLPLVHDHYDGFHVGVPAGWELTTYNDTIAVTRGTSDVEMAVVYPALQTKGLTAASLFAAYSRVLEQSAASAGNALSFHLTSNAGQLPTATVSGRAGHVAVQGHATIQMLQDQTAVASTVLVYSAYWLPASRMSTDGVQLADVGRCYGPEAGTLYQVFQDQVFAFALPLGWQVADEGQDAIDLTGDSGHSLVSYVLTLLPASESGTTARSLLDAMFSVLHIQVSHFLWTSSTAPQQGTNGSLNSSEEDEFTGVFRGQAVHGLVFVTSSAGAADTGGVLRLGMTTAAQWNTENSGLIKVMTSVRHSINQDLQQWQHLTQQWQQFDQVEQQFDDTINGVEEVQDPTTGRLYAAPFDSYEANGPDGPGYYINDGGFQQRLQPVKAG